VKVLILSKALLVRTYRQKLTELSRLGVEVVAVVPQDWREPGAKQRFEPDDSNCYELIRSPLRFSGRFHLHYYPALPRLVRGSRPDLLHLDEEPFNLATYLGMRASRAAHVPFLFFSWQNLLHRYPPPFSAMESSVYRSAAHALAGSLDAASVLRHKGYVGPLSIVPQFGVDADLFRPGPKDGNRFTVGFLNRLTPGKAPLLALKAFSSLPEDARLRVIGDGPLRSRLEAEIERHALSPRVSLETRIPSSQMPDVMRNLDVVLLPSITTRRWKEQFGRVLIEAMASGVPVVGSDSGEIPRVIGDAGLVVPEGDVDALGNALRRLYDDRNLARRLAESGRRRVLEHFTHDRVARLTHEAYVAALAR